MGYSRKAPEDRMIDCAKRHRLNATMYLHISRDHVEHKKCEDQPVNWQKCSEQRDVEGVQDRLRRAKSVGSKSGRSSRAVMRPVQGRE